MVLGMEVGLGPGHIVLDGDPAPPPKKQGHNPHFRPMSIVVKRLDASGYHVVGGRLQPRRHCARWGPSYPSPKGAQPQSSAHVRCGQTAGWTKMSLGMEVGLGPGDFVRRGR